MVVCVMCGDVIEVFLKGCLWGIKVEDCFDMQGVNEQSKGNRDACYMYSVRWEHVSK